MSISDLPVTDKDANETLEQTQTLAPAVVGPSWQEQDDVLRDMWLKNQTPQAIAESLGRSTAAIMTRAARLGLPRRSSPGRKPGQRRQDNQTSVLGGNDRSATATRSQVASETSPLVSQTSPRVCLMCLTKFQSQGRHNRICSTCRHSSEYESASSLPDIHFPVS